MTTLASMFIRAMTGLIAAGALMAVTGCGAVVDPQETSAAAESEQSSVQGSEQPTGQGAENAPELPADVVEAGSLTVAIGQSTVPTHFIEDGELVGFNVDVTGALSERLGVEFELVQVPFDSVIPGIAAQRYDTALYNVSNNAERREVVDFLDYAKSGSVIVTRAGETQGITTDPLTLCGTSVAVVAGQQEFAKLQDVISPQCEEAGQPAVDAQTFDADATVQQAVASGRVDAMVDGATATPYMVSQNADTFELIGPLAGDSDPLGMPFAKDRQDLVEAFRAAWIDLYRSGDYERLAEEWEVTALLPDSVDFFTVNSGEGSDGGE